MLRDADIRKMKAWRAAGFEVQRLSTPAVYADPNCLLALVPASNVGPTPS